MSGSMFVWGEDVRPRQNRNAGKGLADGIREPELLAAGQHEQAVSASLVGDHLQL